MLHIISAHFKITSSAKNYSVDDSGMFSLPPPPLLLLALFFYYMQESNNTHINQQLPVLYQQQLTC